MHHVIKYPESLHGVVGAGKGHHDIGSCRCRGLCTLLAELPAYIDQLSGQLCHQLSKKVLLTWGSVAEACISKGIAMLYLNLSMRI